jgi:hypothetical protein
MASCSTSGHARKCQPLLRQGSAATKPRATLCDSWLHSRPPAQAQTPAHLRPQQARHVALLLDVLPDGAVQLRRVQLQRGKRARQQRQLRAVCALAESHRAAQQQLRACVGVV